MSPSKIEPVRVAICGRRTLLRNLLQCAFEAREGFPVVGVAESPAEFMAIRPDLIVADAYHPNQIFAQLAMIRASLPSKVMIVTLAVGGYQLVRALAAGVTGFVHETETVDALMVVARATAKGHVHYSPAVNAQRLKSASLMSMLSAREIQVLELAVRGTPDSETGAAIGLAPSTVESYRTGLMKKIGARDWAHLMVMGLRMGATGLDEIAAGTPERRSARRGG